MVSTTYKQSTLGNEQLPSILEQTNWDCGFYSFPRIHRNTEYFNCGVVDWRGQRWLVTRKRVVHTRLVPGHNSIAFWLLENNQPTREHPVKIHVAWPGEHHEDPRAYNFDGELFISYCNFRNIHGSYAHQCLAALTGGFHARSPLRVVYGNNGAHLMGNKWHEKNWTWFRRDGQLFLHYMTFPQVVCRVDGTKVVEEFKTEKFNWLWQHGEPRGGSPPVLIGDRYYCFFHSSLPNEQFRARYYMGAMSFSAKPPFQLLEMTNAPLLGGSEFDPRNSGAPLVVFPEGAIYDNGVWFVTMGVNDCACAWIKIPHGELLKKMHKCA